MDHSLEGLVKERSVRYRKFDFSGVTHTNTMPKKRLFATQPKKIHQGFMEDSRPRNEPPMGVREVSSVDVSSISAEAKFQVIAAPVGFSFFAGSLFLCLAMLVLHTLPEGTFLLLNTLGHITGERVDVASYRIPEVTLPLVVFGIASVLSCGYFLSWIVRIFMRIYRRLFGHRQNEG